MLCEECHQPVDDDCLFCQECGAERPTNHTCQHCEQPVKAGQKFCTQCGKPPELKCSKCGTQLNPGKNFCGKCGQKVEEPTRVDVCSSSHNTTVDGSGPFCADCGNHISDGSPSLRAPTLCSEQSVAGEEQIEREQSTEKGQSDKQENDINYTTDKAEKAVNTEQTDPDKTVDLKPENGKEGGSDGRDGTQSDCGDQADPRLDVNNEGTATANVGSSTSDGVIGNVPPHLPVEDPLGATASQVTLISERHASFDPNKDVPSQLQAGTSPSATALQQTPIADAPAFHDPNKSSNDAAPKDSGPEALDGSPATQPTEDPALCEGAAAPVADRNGNNSVEDDNKGENDDSSDCGSEDEDGRKEKDEDDGGSSKSRDSSQHRQKKGKGKRRPQTKSSKQKKREKRNMQQHTKNVKQATSVIFHVVISKEFKSVQVNNHRVFLCWKPDADKPSPTDLIELHHKRGGEECGALYEAAVELSQFSKDRTSVRNTYKYCVEVDGRYSWEKLYWQKEDKYRKLNLPRQQKGTCHVFDWIAYPSGMKSKMDTFKSLVGIGTSSKDIFSRDMRIACSLFLPKPDMVMDLLCNQVDKTEKTAEDILELIARIELTVPFYNRSDVQKFMEECIEGFLQGPLLELTKTVVNTEKLTVVLGMFLLILSQSSKLCLTMDDRPTVYKALLIKPDVEKKTCPEIAQLQQHFPKLMKEKGALQQIVLTLMLGNMRDNCPSWIYTLPLLHLLSGQCNPFCKLQPNQEHRTPVWWGTSDVEKKVDGFKNATKSGWCNDRPVRTVHDQLLKAFIADPLMQRSFVATLNVDQLLCILRECDFPAEIIMASLFYHLHTNSFIRFRVQEIVDIIKHTTEIVEALVRSVEKATDMDMDYFTMLGAICEDLLIEVTEIHCSSDPIIHGVVLLQLSILAMLTRPDQCNKGKNKVIKNQLIYSLKNWMQFIRYDDYKSVFEMMGECICRLEEIPDPSTSEDLKNLFLEIVRHVLSKLPPFNKLEAMFKLMETHGPLTSVVSVEDIYSHLEQALAEDQHRIDNFLLINVAILEVHLSNLYKKKCSRASVSTEDQQLELLFTWKPMLLYLRICNSDGWRANLISKDVAEKVKQTYSFLHKLIETIKNGRVSVRILNWLLRDDNCTKFCEVVSVVTNDHHRSYAVLKLREKELQAFQCVVSDVSCLLRLCQEFITTDDASAQCATFREKTGNIENRKITDICKSPKRPEQIRVEDYTPSVHVEAVPERFRDKLPSIGAHLKSPVFQYMLKRCAGPMNISPDSKFWEVLVSLWHEAESEWFNACDAMRRGEITVEEVDRLFSGITKNDKWEDRCKKEMENMAEDGCKDWVDKRMKQFMCLSMVSTQREAASILCQIKEEFGFTGDVENIRTFQDVDIRQPIGMLDLSVVGTSQALQDIDCDSVQHFRQFGSKECNKFVNWVRETMAEGMKELKVFVDLALNYVGDDPREIDKVRHLRAVITGYAPLIFQASSEVTFLHRCQEVARNIKADSDLPAKLACTIALVEWFDKIHKFHGSVEKTAMAQVDSITRTGILKVGQLQQQNNLKRGLGLCDVLCLDVPAEGEVKEGRTYSYQDLLDLQSRLMLVVGPEDQDKASVDRFISVMDSVVRLVSTYIQLCRDGCLLFLKWTVKFFFDETRGVCCIIEFEHNDTAKQLKGHQDTQGKCCLERYMAMLAHFLDSCHDSWLQYVAKTRRDYEELNLYTMDQLVFLQKQLAHMNSRDISPHVLPLLSLLQTDCSLNMLKPAVQQAADMRTDGKSDAEDEDETDDPKAREMALFIQNMIDNGFSKQLAVRALKENVDPNDLDGGVTWCLAYADEEEKDEEEEEEEKDKPDLSSSSQALCATMLDGTIATALQLLDDLSEKQLSLNSVENHLRDMWKLFLERVTFSGEDYLSLRHIGCVLTVLTQQGVLEVDRKLPAPMSTDTPNLIVCPKSEILKTVTSIYMFTKEAPLPQPDEVLLCTPHTTKEEVGIFFLRAFSAKPCQKKKIHCLTFADYLDYDVGQHVERELKEFINSTRHPYHLVVVCTAENEFNSGITASLERYRQPAPINADDTDMLLKYLCSKFTVADSTAPPPAARVDPDRYCVRVIKSTRSGMGKTLYVSRLVSKLKTLLDEDGIEGDDDYEDDDTESVLSLTDDTMSMISLSSSDEGEKAEVHVTVPLYEKELNSQHVADTLLHRLPPAPALQARIIHLDIAYEVQEGVDHLLYNLLVLGCLTDNGGHVWRRSMSDLYLLEAMPLMEHSESQEQKSMHQIFSILPSIKCSSPQELLVALRNTEQQVTGNHELLLDMEKCRSQMFQRPFQYLSALNSRRDPKTFKQKTAHSAAQVNSVALLETLIKHCGVKNPSWSELNYFVSFLNKQLEDFEHSIFCSKDVAVDLPGFPAFVLKFLIHMSRDFATRSLVLSEECLPALQQFEKGEEEEHDAAADVEGIGQFQMRRTWESSCHPYIFFNPDRTSMTFLGFTVDPQTGNLMTQTGQVLETAIMKRTLYYSLVTNGAPLSEDFDSLERREKLMRLYQVMGVPDEERTAESGEVIDPDDTYELTTDNAKKILAIYMRFRCNIPVIVMGETGCGKTRLVQFLCALQTPQAKCPNSMIIMKVHGGTTSEDIHKKVQEAEALAKKTKKWAKPTDHEPFSHPVYTVLFFDEANTTEAIGAIKEVMCDGAMNGTAIQLHHNLKMVAACNPYRKHSKAVIERLEKAGLGYHISAEKTCDKLGRVPMRQLVYRVQPLPQSMLPLVWDFGQLSSDVEHMYIVQMVRRYVRQQQLGDLTQEQQDSLCKVLVESQAFMRNLKDECSFVSLRDVDRTLMLTSWFLKQTLVLKKINEGLSDAWRTTSNITMSLVLALAVCYRAGLPDKTKFEQKICQYFCPHLTTKGPVQFRHIIDRCQDILLNEVNLGEKIARNHALKENIFMMVVCVELRIPLFLVGKPGSSKSLAKTIVADAMQGKGEAAGEIFQSLKEVQMVSFQCSPLSTADSIMTTFRQCASIQQDKDRAEFVAVVVLDEVGLAEDSPRMPLKALHPLLEDGFEVQEQEDEACVEATMTRFEKMAFIGISNWALDPAKMNRGILVQRDVPDKQELVKTAISICQSGKNSLKHVESLLHKLASAYLEVFARAVDLREFFGLRDFYSLVKMVHNTAMQKNRKLTKAELQAAVRRNFGGLIDFDPVDIFERHLDHDDTYKGKTTDDIDSSYAALLRTALLGEGITGDSRYLLLLTENYSGLQILTDNLLATHSVEPIFGSSFPKDQGYTQICRNINRIKICMETGKTVILLNLDNLYESLYDALNQYYSYLKKDRYVDLGLGTHRVKCKVDRSFRLMVVAEKQRVYDKFPIPLINRLEKHFLSVNSLLSEKQHMLESQLHDWIKPIIHTGCECGQLNVSDVCIGYHPDTAASVVLTAWKKHALQDKFLRPDQLETILQECRATLLWCFTPDAVIRLQDEWCSQVYFQQQQHESLAQFLQSALLDIDTCNDCLMAQVTTHSKLLTEDERYQLEQKLADYSFTLLTLQAFHTEQQFRHQLSVFLEGKERRQRVLLIQCEQGNINQSLLQCAQYCVQSLWSQCRSQNHSHSHVIFLVQLPRVTSVCFSGFIGGHWRCAHVDDLQSAACHLPTVFQLQAASPAQLMASVLTTPSISQSEGADESIDSPAHGGLTIDLVRNLLSHCVLGAVARIHDGATGSSRSTRRIELLLQWFEKRGEKTFLLGVMRMVCAVMQEKETSSSEFTDPSHWLPQHAAQPDWVRKAGTMRRAWMQYLEQEVMPVLAGVVAYLDTNHNLDLLQEDGWLLDMWLKILNNPQLCQVHYSNLLSMSSHPTQLKEFPCHSMFVVHEEIGPSLPFSWLVWEHIEALIGTRSVSGQANDGVEDVIEKSALGQYLKEAVTSDEVAEQFVLHYMADLLHHHFHVLSAQHQLLLQCVRAAMEQVGVVVKSYQLSAVLVKVHVVMANVEPRLHALMDMAACHPQAIQTLQDKRCDHYRQHPHSQPELVEDILLLKILTQELTPQQGQLNTDEGCQTWLDLYTALAPVLSGVLEDADMNCTVDIDWSWEEARQDKHGKLWFSYGPWCRENIAAIRCLWTRVMTLKLFIDYMSPLVKETGKVKVGPISYNLLWTILADDTNMKTKKTLLDVDKFLKRANSQMVKDLLGDVGLCKHCAVKLEGPPVELPCGDRICSKCYTQEAVINHQCPECHKQVPDNFQPESYGCCNREAVEKLALYQQQTSAFLMAIISQLAFSGQTPLEPEAIHHISSYITRRVEGVATVQTQQFTLRDDQMDPSPVLRSFILRLLLKHSDKEVSEFITQHLQDAKQVTEDYMGDNSPQLFSVLSELSLLTIHCVETLEYEKEMIGLADRMLSGNFSDRCLRVKDKLHQARIKLESSPRELSTLKALGRLRYGLSECASMLHEHVVQAAEGGNIDLMFKDLLMEAAIICEMCGNDWPKRFLVKQLCREFGVQTYMMLVQTQHRFLQWIKLEHVQQAEAVPDRYLVCGPEYQAVREKLVRHLRHQDGQPFSFLTGSDLSQEHQQYLILLALHREVPMTLVHAVDHTQVSLIKTAETLVQSETCPVEKDFALALVKNTLGVAGSCLRIDGDHNLAQQSLICILTHLWLALKSQQQHRHHLLGTLLALIHEPDIMMTSYLPTMPQDSVEEIVQGMNIDHTKTIHDYNRGNEIPKLWECPNGHRYAIGNCGRPTVRESCPECGLPIGGVDYDVAAEGNQLSRMRDRTQPGHVLGAAQARSMEAIPERGLSAAACAVIRFLTHGALFLSASQPEQAAAVSQLIRPAVKEQNVISFFWAHLHKDLQVLRKVLGKCYDDVYLLLHHLCHRLTQLPPVHFWSPQLRTKRDREAWEKQFTTKYVRPILQQADAIIQSGNDLLLADTGQDQKQLLNMVFEVGEEDPVDDVPLQDKSTAWKYRLRITVDEFFRHFQQMESQDQDALPVLKLFLQQSHHLRALHYVPELLALQRRVMQQLHHRLSRTDASRTTVKELLDTKEGPDLQKLVTIFSKAWDIVKDLLVSYRCVTVEGQRIHLPEEYHWISVDENSAVGMVLPDTEGAGCCAYLLLHYLLVQHNHFLQLYSPHTTCRYEQLPEVHLSAITHRHLVSYCPHTDLLPLVLAHCNYSLHLGHGDIGTATRLHYDFCSFELQLQNTLLLSKSRVHRQQNGSIEIETLKYCADTTNSKIINRLREKIPQEPLAKHVQHQITSELGENLTDICLSIDSINTTLNFLLTLEVTADQSLHDFMMDMLRMRRTEGILSRKAQQHCQVKHVQSLWLLLCFLRARILATHNQEAFDKQGVEVRQELKDDQKEELTAALYRHSPDRVELMLSHMYESVMLHLLAHSHDDDFAGPNNYTLKWLLCNELENPRYTQQPEDSTQDQLTERDLDHFPDSILASQTISTWLLVLTHLNSRQP